MIIPLPEEGHGAVTSPGSQAHRQLRFQAALHHQLHRGFGFPWFFYFKTYFTAAITKSNQISPSHNGHTQGGI